MGVQKSPYMESRITNYAPLLFSSSFFLLLLLVLGFWGAPDVAEAQNATTSAAAPVRVGVGVGVILDLASESGKRCRTSVSMAIEDLYQTNPNYDARVVLHVRDSQQNAVGAASAAVDLLKNAQVQAIIGPQTSSESAFVAYVGNRTRVPIVSFSATSPSLSPASTPFFVRATTKDSFQAAPIAAFLRAFGWREAVPVYEDSDYGSGILPSLVDAFGAVDARAPYLSVLPPAATDARIDVELYKLMSMQTRVFVVHMPPALGARLFLRASVIGMMSKGYVWVVTDGIADVLETFDRDTIAAMQGVVGFRPSVGESAAGFASRFKSRLRRDYPDAEQADPTVLELRAYDAARAIATAVQNSNVSSRPSFSPQPQIEPYNSTDLGRLGVSQFGPALLAAILNTTFDGLAGEFRLVGGQLQVSACEIVNVIGRSTRTVGYWTPQAGITDSLNPNSMTDDDGGFAELKTIVWPGDPKAVPVGWVVPTSGAAMRIAVPVKHGFNEFVNVVVDPATNRTAVTGFCIDVFEAVMKKMPYYVPYEYVPFDPSADSYDNLVDAVYEKEFDAAVGDTTIVADRSQYVEFTLPYTESGVSMIVAVQEDGRNIWIFLKPLTAGLWFSAIAFFFFTGFVVWAIERRINTEFRGTPSQQLGVIFYFAFSTLVYAHREKLESNLSRFAVIIWLFVVLILTSSYTASLTSMLTVPHLRPAVTDINELLQRGDFVGYQDGSFVFGLLTKQLGFNPSKLVNYSTVDEYANALSAGPSNGGVAAIIDEIPYLQLFLSKYCANYTMVGSTTYKTDGFGFVFPRGSPLVPDISRAILNVTEGDEMTEIERKWFGDPTSCLSSSRSLGSSSLDFWSFGGLFLITGTVSALMFLLFLATFIYKEWDHLKVSASENSFWNKLFAWFKHFDRKEHASPTFQTYVNDPAASDTEVNQEAKAREAAAIRDLDGSQSPESISFTPQRASTTEPSSPRSSRPADDIYVEMTEIKEDL